MSSTCPSSHDCADIIGWCLSWRTAPAESSTSSFTGGNSISLKKIVDMFYDKVLADTELAPFFEKIDMAKLKKHQVRSAAGLRTAACLQESSTRAVCIQFGRHTVAAKLRFGPQRACILQAAGVPAAAHGCAGGLKQPSTTQH